MGRICEQIGHRKENGNRKNYICNQKEMAGSSRINNEKRGSIESNTDRHTEGYKYKKKQWETYSCLWKWMAEQGAEVKVNYQNRGSFEQTWSPIKLTEKYLGTSTIELFIPSIIVIFYYLCIYYIIINNLTYCHV